MYAVDALVDLAAVSSALDNEVVSTEVVAGASSIRRKSKQMKPILPNCASAAIRSSSVR